MGEALATRCGNAAALALALQASRTDTLATFAAFEAALPGLHVPQQPTLNLPLWELGHIGWFQARWLSRNTAWHEGAAADPTLPCRPAQRSNADALYDSSTVPHASRWLLPLPGADATRRDLAAGLEQTLDLLHGLGGGCSDGRLLYFFRLALLHEDMHHEAALYMARALGLPIPDPRWQPHPLPAPPPPLHQAASPWTLGSGVDAHTAFAFDNELATHTVPLEAVEVDAQALRWADFLPFAAAGGYDQARWWCEAGWAWCQAEGAAARHGLEGADPTLPACYLNAFEAQAWCRWAGRRLPTEAEWERAAITEAKRFRWGDVWEWTASAFAPYPGFVAHPYRDYSAPWFDGRPVLRGASFLTQPRLRHPRYRNYFPPARRDVPAGFRTCAMTG